MAGGTRVHVVPVSATVARTCSRVRRGVNDRRCDGPGIRGRSRRGRIRTSSRGWRLRRRGRRCRRACQGRLTRLRRRRTRVRTPLWLRGDALGCTPRRGFRLDDYRRSHNSLRAVRVWTTRCVRPQLSSGMPWRSTGRRHDHDRGRSRMGERRLSKPGQRRRGMAQTAQHQGQGYQPDGAGSCEGAKHVEGVSIRDQTARDVGRLTAFTVGRTRRAPAPGRLAV
jgi:hypothetical protein